MAGVCGGEVVLLVLELMLVGLLHLLDCRGSLELLGGQ